MDTVTINIAQFNDVYQVNEQKIQVDGKQEIIDVTKFAASLENVTSKWDTRSNGTKDGLIIFSGDAFSPSVETSVTQGRHVPPILNALGINVACVGNHEFDMGVPQTMELMKETNFPWLLSNVIDTNTGTVPEGMKEVHVIETKGARVGFVGLVEKDWINAVAGWPDNFEYQDFVNIGASLSAKLRDPNGQYKCDFIIAITHCRVSNDIKLARELKALSPASQATQDISSQQGVDLLLGGHDHDYFVSKGVTDWEGYDLDTYNADAADDRGDVLIVKSGTDFQDLSDISITLKDTPSGSIRKKVISEIRGKRITTRGSFPVSTEVKKVLDQELGTINAASKEPVCRTEVELDVRSSSIRTHEMPISNWIMDSIISCYDSALTKLGYPKADISIMNTGGLRGNAVYQSGVFTLGELMTILPYPETTVVIVITAADLFQAMETGFAQWPGDVGCFPAISGFRVSWDSSKQPGQRVQRIWLLEDSKELGPDKKPILVDKEEIFRTSDRELITVVTEYVAEGGDGYNCLTNKKVLISKEGGQIQSSIVRQSLLGHTFIKNELRKKPEARQSTLKGRTSEILAGVEGRSQSLASLIPRTDLSSSSLKNPFGVMQSFSHSFDTVRRTAQEYINWLMPVDLILQHFDKSISHSVALNEKMGSVDCYQRTRDKALGKDTSMINDDQDAKESLPVIHPVVDGRLEDVAGAAV